MNFEKKLGFSGGFGYLNNTNTLISIWTCDTEVEQLV